MGDGLSVSITADTTQLRAQLAVASANLRSYGAEVRSIGEMAATASAQGRAAIIPYLEQSTSLFEQAKAKVTSLRTELGEFGSSVEHTGGSFSTATREFRALFDELSSGRTRMVPGTLAILGQRVLGLNAATLLAAGGAALLVGGLSYLGVKAVETAEQLGEIEVALRFGGNLSTSAAQIANLAEALDTMGLKSSDAREAMQAFARIPDITHAEFQSLAAEVRDFASATGQSVPKAAEDLAKLFQVGESAEKMAKSLGGVTQAQLDVAHAADTSGDAQAIFAAKLDLLEGALSRVRPTLDSHRFAIMDSLSAMLGYATAAAGGASADVLQSMALKQQNDERQKQIDLLKQATAEMKSTPEAPEAVLKTGVAAAQPYDKTASEIETTTAAMGRMNAAIGLARGADLSKLNTGLAEAKQHLDDLQFGPIMDRARLSVEQLAATWDGTQSGLLSRENEVWAGYLGQVRSGSQQALAIQSEMAKNVAAMRRSGSEEAISAARTSAAAIGSEEGISAAQRLTQERSLWAGVLAGDRLGYAQRQEAQRAYNQASASLQRQEQSDRQAIARSGAQSEIEVSRINLSAEKDALGAVTAATQDAVAQRFAALRDLAQKEYQLDLQQLQQERQVAGQDLVAIAQNDNQKLVLTARLNAELAALNRQEVADNKRVTQQEAEGWRQAFGNIDSDFKSFMSDVLSGHQTIAQAAQQTFAKMAESFIADIASMMVKWLAFEALTGLGNLGLGGAGALAGVVGDPFGASATGLGGAIGSIFKSFDVGTWSVPQTGLAQIHQGEIILPPGLSQQVRSGQASIGGGAAAAGGGSNVNISLSPNVLDAKSFQAYINSPVNMRNLASSISRYMTLNPSARGAY